MALRLGDTRILDQSHPDLQDRLNYAIRNFSPGILEEEGLSRALKAIRSGRREALIDLLNLLDASQETIEQITGTSLFKAFEVLDKVLAGNLQLSVSAAKEWLAKQTTVGCIDEGYFLVLCAAEMSGQLDRELKNLPENVQRKLHWYLHIFWPNKYAREWSQMPNLQKSKLRDLISAQNLGKRFSK